MRTREAAQEERPGEGIGHWGGVLRGLIQDLASGLRRIHLKRTSENAQNANFALPLSRKFVLTAVTKGRVLPRLPRGPLCL
jgi:hypothetical protein